jgi:nucleoside-diphosphate-sugar epimerase
VPVIPIVRNPAKWAASHIGLAPRLAKLDDEPALRAALVDAARIVCCAHACYSDAVLAAAPAAARFVFLGSTRKFSRWPDPHGRGVAAGEAAFLAAGRPGLMLHPTMIYGATGEDNVQRLAALLRWLPVVPLPGDGGALVQPIHQDDVIRAICAALAVAVRAPESLVIAGPEPVPYREFVVMIARAAGLRVPRIVRVPAAALVVAASLIPPVPGLPRVRPAEIRRLLEDKSFDIGLMRSRLGVEPLSLAAGLARTFTKRHMCGSWPGE